MTTDLPGFADPVREAQSAFRAILAAISHPGTIHTPAAALVPPAGLGSASAAALLTLVDAETTLYLGDCRDAARDWVVFHCGATLVEDASQADFVVARALPELSSLADGSDDGPEGGATLFLEVAGFTGGPSFTVSGPGLKAPRGIAVDGLPADFAAAWAANHARFPRGVDLFLCAGAELMALPRSLSIAGGRA